MGELPTHKNEQTGDATLDRIQGNVRDLITYVRQLISDMVLAKPVSLMLAAAFATTAATAQSTPLTFAVKKGESWDLEYDGTTACSSINGMQYAIGAPAGSTVDGWHYSSSANTSAANWLALQIFAVNSLYGACHVGASNAGRFDRFRARVKVAADGFITVMAASVTAGTTTTITAKARLRAQRVAEA